MGKPNYRQIYAMKSQRENRIKMICPEIDYQSGIYAFFRTDEVGIRRCYVGQAVSLLERTASHLAEYDHIGLSLKKHGFSSTDNPYGWKLSFKHCPKEELDEREIATIKAFADSGFQMYNVTSGGQGVGKKQISEYKQPKTYRQGIQQGYRNASKEIANLFEKYLDFVPRCNPPNKNQQKAVEKFNDFLSCHKSEGGG